MSLLHVEFYSQALSSQAHFTAVLPNDVPPLAVDSPHHKRPPKVLMLLHGYSGCESDWTTGSSIRELAAEYNLAVLMPAAGNSFYLNGEATGTRYADFVGKEVPEFAARAFGLDCFSKVMALSSALIIHELPEMKPETGNAMANYAYYRSTFGDLKTAPTRDCNPEVLADGLIAQGEAIPAIFMACGTEDFLYQPNCAFHDFLTDRKIPHVYRTAPGIHNWKFWEANLEPAIRWMLELED